jgi:phytoene/squalene synthetase
MLRRLQMITRGLTARRSHPDLESLASESDPERFLWAVLPHAARSFAASIVVLRTSESRVAAVAYLYARMLDTYEDLLPPESDRPAALRAFAARLSAAIPPPPMPIPETLAIDDRDRLHILLVHKAELVDAVYNTLPPHQRQEIADLIHSMAEGMAWSSDRLSDQGGVLLDDVQLFRYCHQVIGYPAMFSLRLLTGADAQMSADTEAVSEMIQLANITRDIEKDLSRGIAYVPNLRSHLHTAAPTAVRVARERLLDLALARAPAYQRLYQGADVAGRPSARLAAVVMILFIDMH